MDDEHRFGSLADFLQKSELSVDSSLDDGGGEGFPVKGREIEASVMFADIGSFSARTLDMTPVETLVFVNMFFGWIGAEALIDGHGIVDKYIGDEVMVVYSKEFGSEDPFVDAVRAARRMRELDPHNFAPHIGIASGPVIVGWTGNRKKFDVTVYGAPVTLASRCAAVKPEMEAAFLQSTIVFPAEEWEERNFDQVLPSVQIPVPAEHSHSGKPEIFCKPHGFELKDPREIPMKNLDDRLIREIVHIGTSIPMHPPEELAKESMIHIEKAGLYTPRAGTPLGIPATEDGQDS